MLIEKGILIQIPLKLEAATFNRQQMMPEMVCDHAAVSMTRVV
jgi:hypothetical protein